MEALLLDAWAVLVDPCPDQEHHYNNSHRPHLSISQVVVVEYLNWCWRVSDEERQQLPVPEYLTGWRQRHLVPFLPWPAHISR